MGALPQALEIIFEVQRKRSNEKITRRKNKLSNLQNVCVRVFFFLLFVPLLFSKLITFLFLVHLK
jgi:hypothetical protein